MSLWPSASLRIEDSHLASVTNVLDKSIPSIRAVARWIKTARLNERVVPREVLRGVQTKKSASLKHAKLQRSFFGGGPGGGCPVCFRTPPFFPSGMEHPESGLALGAAELQLTTSQGGNFSSLHFTSPAHSASCATRSHYVALCKYPSSSFSYLKAMCILNLSNFVWGGHRKTRLEVAGCFLGGYASSVC